MINLSIDPQLFPQQLGIELGIFLASYTVLNKVLFKPYLDLVHARNAKSTELKAHTVEDRAKSEKLATEYEDFMRAQRKDVAHWVDEEKKKVSEQERALIEAARNKVAAELAASRKSADEQMDIARKELMPLVGEYSSKIVAKLTGKKVTISAAAASAGKEMEKTL
ncbi:MAG: hypothetical protein EB078_13160 [Proteobacteria bacterium]|nr:hypothetical protein [Pseudomonadota bacterium]NDC26064.1 hypothetical protein [Pseudomonadota bacterium]NDD05847.1 hypothetical protein [Pseudomonadota bacterium]